MIFDTWQSSPRKWLIRIAARAFLYPSGENVASSTERIEAEILSVTSSSRSPNGLSRNSGLDHAFHSFAFMGYETLLRCSGVSLARSSLAAPTMCSIGTPSSWAPNKSEITVPAV